MSCFFFSLCGANYACTYIFTHMYARDMRMYIAIHIHTAIYMTKYCLSERYCSYVLYFKYNILNIKDCTTNLHYRHILEFNAY